MKNIAEVAGGIGIAIMMHKTMFEIETEALDKLLDQLGDRLQKFTQGDLRKRVGSTPAAELMAELENIVALLAEANEVAKRRGVALNEFRAWALNQPIYDQPIYDRGATLLLVDKAADSFAGDTDAMIENGTLRRFYQPQATPIDPAATLGDTVMRHRHDNDGGF
jgi:hypothetical protein